MLTATLTLRALDGCLGTPRNRRCNNHQRTIYTHVLYNFRNGAGRGGKRGRKRQKRACIHMCAFGILKLILGISGVGYQRQCSVQRYSPPNPSVSCANLHIHTQRRCRISLLSPRIKQLEDDMETATLCTWYQNTLALPKRICKERKSLCPFNSLNKACLLSPPVEQNTYFVWCHYMQERVANAPKKRFS